ncbi:MAG: 50S ribosome-binding GTPase [Lentisphaeria bacterium]|nr:50S ribosome-binding GTPase [Lentisphaeria bacterium]
MNNSLENYRKDELRNKLSRAGFRPLDVMLTGTTGAGKSSTINAIFNASKAAVGFGCEPETQQITHYTLHDFLRFWDTPGLGDSVAKDAGHKRNIAELLDKKYNMHNCDYGFIDMVLLVIEGSRRDLGTTCTLLNEVIMPRISSDRILVIINQADAAMKGRHWDAQNNKPDAVLQNFLQEQARSVKERLSSSSGLEVPKIVHCSAEYGSGIKEVMDFIIDRMPLCRRPVSRLAGRHFFVSGIC